MDLQEAVNHRDGAVLQEGVVLQEGALVKSQKQPASGPGSSALVVVVVVRGSPVPCLRSVYRDDYGPEAECFCYLHV